MRKDHEKKIKKRNMEQQKQRMRANWGEGEERKTDIERESVCVCERVSESLE